MTMDSDDDHDEQEEAMVALLNQRATQVQLLQERVSYYQSQVENAKKLLSYTKSKLESHRSRRSKRSADNRIISVKEERSSSSPVGDSECVSFASKKKFKPLLVIPSFDPGQLSSEPVIIEEGNTPEFEPKERKESNVDPKELLAVENQEKGTKRKLEPKECKELNVDPKELLSVETREKGTKRKSAPREHKESNVDPKEVLAVETREKGTKRNLAVKEDHSEVIPLVKSISFKPTIQCATVNLISSQHKRKMRTIAVNPVNDQQFVTSSLDGMVNLWKVESAGSGASLVSTTDCLSQPQRKWPEDIAWHPDGKSLFSVYSANEDDSQISVLDLNPTRNRVTFLEEKPHKKGIINSISFMPWEKSCFATGGSDHGVVFWDEKEGRTWKADALHRTYHSSAVMGVAGLRQKDIVLSAGADKRIIGFDLRAQTVDFKHQLDSKCMSVLPNPRDVNLFMVHAGTLEMQLRLFDIRSRRGEINSFGWKQESSESQSALISQSWSPDGFYIASGSADPLIHIFDIRFNSDKPSHSIRAHHKRVFKALWLNSLPLLLSISSDLNIGFHKFTPSNSLSNNTN